MLLPEFEVTHTNPSCIINIASLKVKLAQGAPYKPVSIKHAHIASFTKSSELAEECLFASKDILASISNDLKLLVVLFYIPNSALY